MKVTREVKHVSMAEPSKDHSLHRFVWFLEHGKGKEMNMNRLCEEVVLQGLNIQAAQLVFHCGRVLVKECSLCGFAQELRVSLGQMRNT